MVTNSFASLIFVEEGEEMNISLCESLLYLDTKPLKEDLFTVKRCETPGIIDKDIANYAFRRVGSALSLTERASEKTLVIKDGKVHFNTGIFAACAKSPFDGETSFVLYKQVVDIIAVLSEISKVGLTYALDGDVLHLNCDGNFRIITQVGVGERVEQFLSPTADYVLNFSAGVSLVSESLLRLISTVKSLDYLSEIITLNVNKDSFAFEIVSVNHSKKSTYTFAILDGTPEQLGTMKVSVDILQTFFSIAGDDVIYAFNQNGLGIENSMGKFLLRKS